MAQVTSIICAGGAGKRVGRDLPKQFLHVCGVPLILRTISAFEACEEIRRIIITCPSEYISMMKELLLPSASGIDYEVIQGGETRQMSVWNALANVSHDAEDIILVHDAARPFVAPEQIKECICAVKACGAAALYVPAVDTITLIRDGFVQEVPPREYLYCAQTPQGFRYRIIRNSHEKALASKIKNATDDVSLALAAGYSIKMVEGRSNNIKITTKDDFSRAELILNEN